MKIVEVLRLNEVMDTVFSPKYLGLKSIFILQITLIYESDDCKTGSYIFY